MPALAAIVTSVQDGLDALADMAATAGLDPRAVEAITNLSSAIDDWLQQGLRAIVESAAFWATVGILAAFLTFFFLQDGDGGWRWCIQAARGSQRDRLTAAGASALSRSGGHLRRTAARSALDAIALLVVLVVLDIQPAGALAVLMLIGGFVPYVGRLAAGTVVVLVALASAGASLAALLALGLVIAAAAEQVFVVPRLPGGPAGLHPIAVLVALPVGAELGGMPGLICAVPVSGHGGDRGSRPSVPCSTRPPAPGRAWPCCPASHSGSIEPPSGAGGSWWRSACVRPAWPSWPSCPDSSWPS